MGSTPSTGATKLEIVSAQPAVSVPLVPIKGPVSDLNSLLELRANQLQHVSTHLAAPYAGGNGMLFSQVQQGAPWRSATSNGRPVLHMGIANPLLLLIPFSSAVALEEDSFELRDLNFDPQTTRVSVRASHTTRAAPPFEVSFLTFNASDLGYVLASINIEESKSITIAEPSFSSVMLMNSFGTISGGCDEGKTDCTDLIFSSSLSKVLIESLPAVVTVNLYQEAEAAAPDLKYSIYFSR